MQRFSVIQQASTHSQETNKQKEAIIRKLWAEISKKLQQVTGRGQNTLDNEVVWKRTYKGRRGLQYI